MAKAGKAKPTKVELSPHAKDAIARLLPKLQSERDNYQIGVGTVIAELIEQLANRPDLIEKLLQGPGVAAESVEKYSPHPKAQGKR